ncbi:uncharacterized protein MONBRDRAFT_5109 [Monosiga brevicollis MX1]|uniref:Uncharacterized protein n=1 Tax=Monosiga brevicollis TaxID=81824 RepID=A9UPY4_MONBE|nr:uncharacterized protein MONBRDRAFT_5109 [Monosiga brevicollis MX1]EDQ92955.1 predicted protein [Monosiga brevicollis MX1]|eukprot:XP_001742717.1 hypothetical protein [Monosiga brevicollis MX1]
MIVEVVCELLEIRRSARENALNENNKLLDRIPKLSSAELALLTRHQDAESSDNPVCQVPLSNDWFRGLESDSNIHLTTTVTQNSARVTAATAEACTRHFLSLDELLADRQPGTMGLPQAIFLNGRRDERDVERGASQVGSIHL